MLRQKLIKFLNEYAVLQKPTETEWMLSESEISLNVSSGIVIALNLMFNFNILLWNINEEKNFREH